MIDHERVRADTPGAADQVFLDSCGSSLPPAPVLETVIGHLRREAEVGGYRAAAERREDLAAVRTSLGTLLGADPAAIALMDSATRAWAQFFYAVPLRPGDRILVAEVEYASNAISALQRAAAHGARVEAVRSDGTGQLDLEALDRMLDDDVRLVSVVHVPTNGGIVAPVREISRLAHAHGALVLLDACQSVGQLPVDVEKLGVDALSGTGRKWLRGPRGTGFLWVRPSLLETLEPPVLDLHSAEWTAPDDYRVVAGGERFEMWEFDHATRLGLGAAADYLLELGIDDVAKVASARAARLRAGLAEVPGVTVRDLGTPEQQSALVTFTIDGMGADEVTGLLLKAGVTVSVSRRPSTLLDMSARGLDTVVRAAPHYFVDESQIDEAVAAVATIATGGR
ncbi:MAG: aminotransferase class V-fold PLP-dependent enzyme [Frankiaceae bacterium]